MGRNLFFKSLLPFLPLLGLYIVLLLAFSSNELTGDEGRHIRYATNLTQGHFTNANNPDLSNGPGYPLVLAPFVALNANLIIPKLLNALFILIGVIYLHKSLVLYTKRKHVIIIAYLIGLYPPLIRFMPFLYSEPLAFMLICAIIFHVCKLYQEEKTNWKHLLLTSFYLGFLVLVKILFFQVMVLSLLILAGFFLINKNRQIVNMSFIILGGFILISPYLIHAYTLTGKLFYLGTGGGEILYHRSTPYNNEWGNWFSTENVLGLKTPQDDKRKIYNDLSSLSKNHRDFYLKLESMSHIERDSSMKAKAFENMKEYPGKYMINTVSNIGRLFFHYPFSYREQNLAAYGYMITNMFILVLWVLSLYPACLARKNVPFEIKALMVFTLIYACGIVLLGGRGRHFIVMVPTLVFFLVFVYTNILKINFVKPTE